MRHLGWCLLWLATSSAVWAQVPARVEDAVIDTLLRADVYVAPGLESAVDAARLQQVANELKPFTTKFAVVPLRDRQTRDRWATGLRLQLNIDDGAVLVLVPKMPNLQGGVSVSSGVLPTAQVEQVVRQHLTAFSQQGYTEGLARLARALRDRYVSERRQRALGTVALVGIPVALVLGGVGWVLRRRAQEVARLRMQLQEMRAQVLEGIEYLDGYLDVLPDGEDATYAREHRQRAAELQSEAVQLMESAKRPQQLWRAEHLLDKAQISVEKAKKYILRAGGDTTIQVEEEPAEPLRVVPNDRTYACFFCSKPPTLGELQLAEVTIGEETRKVWACEECAEQIQRGDAPQVRVIRDGDHTRPWYAVPDYDPYRDYQRDHPGMEWMSLLLLGSLLSQPAPVVIPGHEPMKEEGGSAPVDAGSGDFFASTFPLSDSGDLGVGSSDFFDSTSPFEEPHEPNAGGADFFDSLFGGIFSSDVNAGGADFADFDVGDAGDFDGDAGGDDF
jgi:hypothetical protein